MKKNKKKFIYFTLFFSFLSLILSFSFFLKEISLDSPNKPRVLADYVTRRPTTIEKIEIKDDTINKDLINDRTYEDIRTTIVKEESVEKEPKFSFGFRDGEKFDGSEKIYGKVENAKKIEFYAIKKGSIEPKYYLGEAKRISDTKWERKYDTKDLPNGDYKIIAKVKNEFGTYEGGQVNVEVVNVEVTKKEDEEIKTVEKMDIENSTSKTPSEETEVDTIESSSSNSDSSSDSNPDSNPDSSDSRKIRNIIKEEELIKKETSLSDEEKQDELEKLSRKKEEIKKAFISRREAELLLNKQEDEIGDEEKNKLNQLREQLETDSDSDGLSDYEEERLGTDIFSADSDNDGYLDGDEVKGGFDPKKYSPGDKSDKIVYQEPKEAGEESDFYKINEVKIISKKDEGQNKNKLAINGVALPNSFVTIFIYSDNPIVMTVKTDKNGRWSYELDKELNDGTHEAYVAITNNKGEITSKSKPFSFIKTAQAVSAVDSINSNEFVKNQESPISKSKNWLAFVVLGISIVSFGLALFSSWVLIKERKTT